MASRFIRLERTASGAVAVQIADKEQGKVTALEHIGSAHSDAELALLFQAAQEKLRPGQCCLSLGPLKQAPPTMASVADWTQGQATRDARDAIDELSAAGRARVAATGSLLLWRTLEDAWRRLGFETIRDEAFRKLALARVVEPVSKADSLRVLSEIGVASPSLRTVFRTLRRCLERDYRGKLAAACLSHSLGASGALRLVLYDVTTLWFTSDAEDELRRCGMSKEHRPGPQVQVGLLTCQGGFPLDAHLFAGNVAETRTLIPAIAAFRQRYAAERMVVVADGAMLSAENLNALEDAGLAFIVGSRISTAPYDLAGRVARRGALLDGQIIERERVMGAGSAARRRRVVYSYSERRRARDEHLIGQQVEKAERIVAGQAPQRKARFLKVQGAKRGLDEQLIERARSLAGLKGYVTNLAEAEMDGAAIIAAYHDLFQVERSFRMAKSDLRARPVFHHTRDSIEAHLTIVLAALAVSRHLQDASGVSIRRLVQTLRPVRSATVTSGDKTLTIEPEVPSQAREILDAIERSVGD